MTTESRDSSRSDAGDLHLATVVLNVHDMRRAVEFWTSALGYEQREDAWSPDFMMLVDPARRLLPVSLGATRVDDWPYPEDADFVVLRDPDDNEFCVIDHAAL